MPERRFGLIGCGRIGRPVLRAWRDGALPGWRLTAVLARHAREVDGIEVGADADAFFAPPLDLIVDAAGPAALREHGMRALQVADVWTVGAAALADAALATALAAGAERSGHRLRLVSGALVGLDGIAMTAVSDAATLRIEIVAPRPRVAATPIEFEGSVREAARRFPDELNVAVAAAWAGPGLDRSVVSLRQADARVDHRLAARAQGAGGRVTASLRVGGEVHPVAACLIADLRREAQAVWAG